jgi:hypothetical protein
MKVDDLIILSFPSSDRDEEVIGGAEALYVKHVRKHLVDRGSDGGSVKARTEAKDDTEFAQRAWLIQMNNSRGLTGEGDISEGEHYKIVESTHSFPQNQFKPNTGVYVINHAQGGICNLFDIHFMNWSHEYDNNKDTAITFQAESLANVFQKIGINACSKVVFLACNIAEHSNTEKSFLQEFVVAMHSREYKTMVAGWDLPLVVVADKRDANYGKKRGQGGHYNDQLVAGTNGGKGRAIREKHKFVYVYRSQSLSFNCGHPDDVDKMNSARELAMKRFYRKNREVQKASMKLETKQQGQGKKFDLILNFVEKLKYGKSGWSKSV